MQFIRDELYKNATLSLKELNEKNYSQIWDNCGNINYHQLHQSITLQLQKNMYVVTTPANN